MLPIAYSMRNLARRPVRTLLTAGGIAVATALVVLMTAFASGLTASLDGAAHPDNVMVLSLGAEADPVRSAIDRNQADRIAASMPGVKEDANGRYTSVEVYQMTPVGPGGSDEETDALALVRGVTPGAYRVHGSVYVTAGREPRGDFEVMVGALAGARTGLSPQQLAVGRTLRIEDADWTIVGHFASPGKPLEAELWVSLNDLMTASRRSDVTLVAARMDGDDGLLLGGLFLDERSSDLQAYMVTETQWFEQLVRFVAPISLVAQVLALMVLVGGVIGCANTLYANSLARTAEMGVLQVIGYRRRELVTGLLLESLMLAALAGLLGMAIAVAIGPVSLRIPMGAFTVRAAPDDLLTGAGAALLIGVLGALAPAIRLFRMPVVRTLTAH